MSVPSTDTTVPGPSVPGPATGRATTVRTWHQSSGARAEADHAELSAAPTREPRKGDRFQRVGDGTRISRLLDWLTDRITPPVELTIHHPSGPPRVLPLRAAPGKVAGPAVSPLPGFQPSAPQPSLTIGDGQIWPRSNSCAVTAPFHRCRNRDGDPVRPGQACWHQARLETLKAFADTHPGYQFLLEGVEQ